MPLKLEEIISQTIQKFLEELDDESKKIFLNELEKITQKYEKENYENKSEEEIFQIFLEYLSEVYNLMINFQKAEKN